ncbi:MAG: BatA and WFA domain-containing protein [Cyclobacteriaceae bacterium]|nr:BatA and WFA domain-containing protein [Cyclobacteriaceae bacterium]
MSFAYPLFLWALAVLAIPVIIHLFNFRKTTRILFSNTRLLQQVKQETTQKRKLKQYLILASRLLFLAFLVLAFAQPFLPATEQITPGREVTLYIDNSYSMTSGVGDQTRALDAGLSFAREVVELFPADTRYKLLTNDFAPYSNSYKAKSELLDLLTQVRLSPLSRTYAEIRDRTQEEDNELFWISDFQKSTLALEGAAADSVHSIHLVSLPIENASNVFVDSVFLEDPFMVSGQPNTLHVRIRNNGVKVREGLVVKLTINQVQSGAASVDLQPNEVATVKFDLAQGLQGMNRLELSFTDFPVSFDNLFYLTLNLSSKIRIVEVGNGSGFIAKVFGNSDLFSFRSFSPGNVDLGILSQADLVILHGVDNPDAGLSAAVREYQLSQGTVFIIPSSSGTGIGWRSLAGNLPITKVDNGVMQELDKPDFQNPFFENVFEEQTAALSMPRAKPLISWGSDRSALLSFKDGTPFLSRTGSTYVMAAPLENTWSDFQNHALFVPVMYRMAASGHRVSQKPYYLLTERLATLQMDSLAGETPVMLTGKQEIVPSQRRNGDRVILEIPRFSVEPGFYTAHIRSDTLGLIAFDMDKRESLLDQWTAEEVKSLLGGGNNISIFQPAAQGSFTNEIKERYLGRQLWKYALALALLFLLAEVLLIRFMK